MSMEALASQPKARLTEEELADGFLRLASREWRVGDAQPFVRRLKAVPAISAPFLVEHLMQGGPSERETATALLRLLAGPRVIVPLREVLRDGSAPDEARVAAAVVLEGIGEEVDAGVLTADLKDPLGLFSSIWEAAIAGAQDEAFLESLVQAVQAGPAPGRDELIRSLAEPGDPRALYILKPLLYGKRVGTIIAAIEAIEILDAHEAGESLKDLCDGDPSPQVRQRARAAYGRLVMRSNPLFTDPDRRQPLESAPGDMLPLHRCWATLIDGSGGQAVTVSRRHPDGNLKVISVQIDDMGGVKSCLGSDGMREEELGEIEADLVLDGLRPVPLALEECRSIVEEARRLSLATRVRLPIEFEVWKGLLEGNTPRVQVSLEGQTEDSQQVLLALLPQTDILMAASEFQQWLFDPGLVAPYLDEWSYAPPEQHATPDGQQTLDTLVDLAISDLVKDEQRRLLSRRLRRQSWLLQKLGLAAASRLATAAAVGLDPQTGVPAQVHPFLRAMVLHSFYRAGLRVRQPGLATKGW